jgi:glycosyltransferase involved in cell wall biosynthesis
MKRILYVSSAADRGGAEVVLMEILTHLDRNRFRPEVVSLQEGNLAGEIQRQFGIPVTTVPISRFRDLQRGGQVVRQLARVAREHGIDLVHANGTAAHLYGGLAAHACCLPSIYHLHDVPVRSWTSHGLIHLAASYVPATAVIAVSQFVADQYRACVGSCRNVQVIHNAVSLASQLGCNAETVRQRFGWAAEAPLVVWAGRLQQWKGAHIFLRAAVQIRRQMPNARFLLVGGDLFALEPDYVNELKGLAEQLGLNDCLRFTGHVSDVVPFLSAADVVVHSSIRPEPFGLVVLEAMSLGRAVVASAAGGPTELIVSGESGMLVQPGSIDELSSTVLQLLGNEPVRNALGRAASARVTEFFNAHQMVVKLHDLYDRLVALSNGSARCTKSSPIGAGRRPVSALS